jgi:RimJ/RimL family protein N-acetyltransferase
MAMAIDAAGSCIILSNGRRVRLRPLLACEAETVRELYAHLSPRTRYLRFLSPMPTLPDSVLRVLLDLDQQRRMALVAHHAEGQGEVVGLGSFGAVDDDSAEVGLVIRDDWQRQGLGTVLATRVLQAAENRGFHRFIAHVSSDNEPMRKIIKQIAVVISAKLSGRASELVFTRRLTI